MGERVFKWQQLDTKQGRRISYQCTNEDNTGGLWYPEHQEEDSILWGWGMLLVFSIPQNKCPINGDEERQKPTFPTIYFFNSPLRHLLYSYLFFLLTQTDVLLIPSSHFYLKALFYLPFVPGIAFICTPQPIHFCPLTGKGSSKYPKTTWKALQKMVFKINREWTNYST